MSLGASAAAEWDALVSTAVVGTDRRPPPPPAPGWDTWVTSDDPAVQVLDRAAAVVTARRAGARPLTVPPVTFAPAPPDDRPPCPGAWAARLARILGGEHEVLLAEWLDQLERSGRACPWQWLPALLLRARRDPSLDLVVRRCARGRAEWLAELVPELGLPTTPTVRAGTVPLAPPAAPPDSGAAATAVVSAVADGRASWAAAPQLQQIVAALDPAWLPSVVASLSALPFDVTTERTRAAVVELAEFRSAMLLEFAEPADPGPAVPVVPADPGPAVPAVPVGTATDAASPLAASPPAISTDGAP